jgi:electron transport complex protein RnfG
MKPIATDRPAPTPIARMYQALVGIGMLCALLIVGVYLATGPRIQYNRAQALERAILEVLPGAVSRASLVVGDSGTLRPASSTDAAADTVHAGFDRSGQLVGVAIPGAGMGYQDVISVLFGYNPHQETIVGLRVLSSRETPGLGDKIETDPAFLANFDALPVPLDTSGRALRHELAAVKQGASREPWEIDGITGATISSQAIARILAQSSARWLPLIQNQLGPIATSGETNDDA